MANCPVQAAEGIGAPDTDISYIRDYQIPLKPLSISGIGLRLLPVAEPKQETAAQHEEMSEGMYNVLGTLLHRERRAIVLRYGLDGLGERKYAQIGKELRVTGSRAGQIVNKAIRKLRSPPRSRLLLGFSGDENVLDDPKGYASKLWRYQHI